ncbi:hypothetical protein SuNHUV7_27340 (plasmid) [Pseudoseohaeicola sp. NH-UV-7]|uniref:DUF2147 domain-containing protein n=1 Tax=unclassified Sulfitobacter TaxID=196795 RepID=UPI0020C76906|nr:DUF2147 domain-containing protein [Sulfitobacter sp. JL08]
MFRFLFAVSFSVICTVSAAQASDAVIGLWKTEPDRKKLTSHIEIRECGVKICGKVMEAFDVYGKSVKTRNVGRELFWDVEDLGSGNYGNGTVFVPLLNVKASASMKLAGNTLKVTGCKGKICDGQTWTRLK